MLSIFHWVPFLGVLLGHMQLLDFKGFLWQLTLTDTKSFFFPSSLALS